LEEIPENDGSLLLSERPDDTRIAGLLDGVARLLNW
jgi:hypothetical protein